MHESDSEVEEKVEEHLKTGLKCHTKAAKELLSKFEHIFNVLLHLHYSFIGNRHFEVVELISLSQ